MGYGNDEGGVLLFWAWIPAFAGMTFMGRGNDEGITASRQRKRRALSTTTRELTDIPIAAIQGVISPKAAMGKTSAL